MAAWGNSAILQIFIGMCGTPPHGVQTTPGTTSDHSMMLKGLNSAFQRHPAASLNNVIAHPSQAASQRLKQQWVDALELAADGNLCSEICYGQFPSHSPVPALHELSWWTWAQFLQGTGSFISHSHSMQPAQLALNLVGNLVKSGYSGVEVLLWVIKWNKNQTKPIQGKFVMGKCFLR